MALAASVALHAALIIRNPGIEIDYSWVGEPRVPLFLNYRELTAPVLDVTCDGVHYVPVDSLDAEPVMYNFRELAARLPIIYPGFLWEHSEESVATFQIWIDEDGQIVAHELLESSHDAVIPMYERLIRERRFHPGRHRGELARVTGVIELSAERGELAITPVRR